MALTRGLVPAMEERFVVVLSFKSICCSIFLYILLLIVLISTKNVI